MHNRLLAVIGLSFTAMACFAQALSIPKQFQGKWASSPDRCSVHHEDEMTIGSDRISFYESRGKLLAVRVVSSLEVELDLELTGEGQTWRRTQRFALSDDGRTLTDPTIEDPIHKFARVRCG